MAATRFDSNASAHPLQNIVTALLIVAMLMFTYTVVIGILNGTDVVEFDRKTLLSHVHAGTLGWITMGIFAASLWLFGVSDTSDKARKAAVAHAIAAIVTLPVFALTFAFTYGTARAILGTLALLTILAFCVWTIRRIRTVQMTTPHLAFVAALVTSVTGGVLGVLLATEIARGWNVAPSGISDAHPGTMVIGFLTPVGMALAEWGLRRGNLEPLTRLGIVQVALPFVGSLILMVGLLWEITPLPPIGALANLIGIGIMVWRLWRPFRATSWLTPSMGRFAAASGIWLIVSIVFVNYLAGRHEGDFNLVPTHQLLALDHAMFIGVLTNAIFVLLLAITAASGRFARIDHIVFYGMNVGLAGFIVGLMAESSGMKHLSTPVMGACILLGLAAYAVGLLDRRETEEPPAATPQAAQAGS